MLFKKKEKQVKRDFKVIVGGQKTDKERKEFVEKINKLIGDLDKK